MGVRQVCCSTSTILRLDCAAHLGGRLVISLVGLLLAAPVEALQGMLLLILWRHLIVVGCILLSGRTRIDTVAAVGWRF